MSDVPQDWTLRMTLQLRFRGKRREEIFDLITAWWFERGHCYNITATEIATLSKTPPPPTVEISGLDLL